jgi:hypothetical protein
MIRQSTPFQNGSATIQMRGDDTLAWHELSLSFQKADTTPYGAVTGSATMSVIGTGSDLEEAGANPLDLATQRRWAPFLSGISQVTVTVTGAPADAFCVATIATKA